MADTPRTILVYVGLDLMDGGLMKLPFLRALRATYPDASITWLAGKGRSVYARELASLAGPLLDEVIEDAGIGRKWWELLRRPLAGRAFDLVIDTQRRLVTTLIVRRIRHRVFVSAAARYALSDRKPPGGDQAPRAMIRQILDLIEAAAGRPVDTRLAPLALESRLEDEAAARLPDIGRYVGLAPGAGGRHKCWPLENFIALAMRQVKAGRVPVLFLGPAERDWEGEIREALPTAILPLDAGDPAALTIALARRLEIAVANDSGAGHLMAAADIPLISLFGPTAPEKFQPLAQRLTVIRAQDFGGEAMDSIPLFALTDAIDRHFHPEGEIEPHLG